MTAVDSARTTLLKDAVCDHWGGANWGSRYGTSEERKLYFEEIEESRYGIEPYIPAFAGFEEGRDLRILEIRVGAAFDFSQWVKNGAIVTGVDLADAAILLTRENLEMTELGTSRVGFRKPDVENPPCDDASFDIVYSWGVSSTRPIPSSRFERCSACSVSLAEVYTSVGLGSGEFVIGENVC